LPIGGTQEIGAPDYQTYMLQSAIDGDPTKLSSIKWYGWAAIGANGSTNNRGNPSKGIAANSPSAYDVYPNTVVLDQLALYTERLADTTQTDHFDWGFRITNLYGQDYRYTTSHGILSQQLLVKNAQYGYDPVMVYLDFYLPKLGQGADLRIGRYVSLPDIEAQLAPNNYSYSHSILYTYDCYTMVGANLTVKLTTTGPAGRHFPGLRHGALDQRCETYWERVRNLHMALRRDALNLVTIPSTTANMPTTI